MNRAVNESKAVNWPSGSNSTMPLPGAELKPIAIEMAVPANCSATTMYRATRPIVTPMSISAPTSRM
jgi:hypothetical protein